MTDLQQSNENSLTFRDESVELYFVVTSHEEQYSIWPYYKKSKKGKSLLVVHELKRNVYVTLKKYG
ncbi:MAG: hypothetical protein BGO67_03245 [Alphaproteobacteria bacterium 41-28]|nr:MAG: hypothetical protein BGO67_03245 [Alphaproteobacteria bacterium 41-28]